MQKNENGGGTDNGQRRYVRTAPQMTETKDAGSAQYPRRRPGQSNASPEQVQRILNEQNAPRPARRPAAKSQAAQPRTVQPRTAQPQKARPQTAQPQTAQPRSAAPQARKAAPVPQQSAQAQRQPALRPANAQPAAQQRPQQPVQGGVRVQAGNRGLTIKPRFFIFCAVVLMVVIGAFAGLAAVLNAMLAGDAVISYGRIEDVTTVDALIIRDEVSVRAEGYGRIDYKVPELSFVTENTPVVEVYATGYSGEKIQELKKLMVDITQQQNKALGDIMNVTINDYNANVTTQLNSITAAMREEPGKLQGMFDQLSALMQARQGYIEKTTEAKEDPTLAQYYANKTQLLTQIDAWKTQYRSPGEGIISYRFDGLEPYLGMDTLEALTVTAVKELIKENNPQVPDELRAQQNLYRLVEPNRWYVAFTTRTDTWKIGIGETCAIYFESFEDITYNAKVHALTSEGDDLMVLLEMSEDVSPLINARKLTAVIGGRVEGMMVPLGSLKTQGGQQGVYRSDDNAFVPVRVVGQDKKHALIMPLENGALSAGVKVRK